REVFFFGIAGTFPLAMWNVDGPLAIESPAGASVYLPSTLTPGGFVAHVESAPVGAVVTVSVWVDGSPPDLWMSLTIGAGATSATASGVSLAAAGEIPAGTRVYLDGGRGGRGGSGGGSDGVSVSVRRDRAIPLKWGPCQKNSARHAIRRVRFG
ncbi:MAG: hypothetical protein LAQ69_48180, partial [Acidobacteriia bacterium]|nr:hypothetical protein [Terriglobia bacterium]